MTSSGKHYDNIVQRLSAFESNVKRSSQLGRTNINKDAERLFCYPLELLFGGQFINLNTVEANYPAVDLGSIEKRISVQVTSDNNHDKIQSTLDKFFLHDKDRDFDRLIVLIIGERKHYRSSKDTKQAKFPPFELKGKLDFDPDRDIWGTVELLQQIDGLSPDKMEALSGFLDSQLASTGALRPYLYLPPRSAVGNGFVGREKELADMGQQFAKGIKPIVLSGLGGMGKTELAAKFGRDYQGGRVYFTHFQNSFEGTLRNMFSGVHPQPSQPPKEEEQLNTVVQLLEKCTEQDLLIIDNADADSGSLADLMKDEFYGKLMGMKLRLILTTRFDWNRVLPVDPLPSENLYQIFRTHGADLTEGQMDDLIKAVNGHTMTIDLMARTLNGKGWRKVTAEDLLRAIRENTLSREKYRKIATDYNQSQEQAQIYQHLSVVFDVSGIPEPHRNVLRCATLLPQDGMDGELFGYSLSENQQDALDELLDHGWLSMENDLLRIHPIIRLVCREELKPSDESCGDFLNASWKQYNQNDYSYAKYSQLAELFAVAAGQLEGEKSAWVNHAGEIWCQLDQTDNVIELYEKYLPFLEDYFPGNAPLATAYNWLGLSYKDLGDYKSAFRYLENSLAIRKAILAENDPDLAKSYNNIGDAYDCLGDYNKELENKLKALELFKKVRPANPPDLARSYSNVGYAYGQLGDHHSALEHNLKALELFKKVLSPDHPELANSYNNLGRIYGQLNEYNKALEYHRKALEIREKMLPPDHPELATSYSHMGNAYTRLGDHHKALEHHLKALEIQEKVLSPDHPDLANSYNNVGCTYGDLRNYKLALQYQLKDIAIYEKVLPPDHPDLASSYNNLGSIYGELGHYALALQYLQQALEIYEKKLPTGHSHTSNTRHNIQYCQKQLQMQQNMAKAGFNFADPFASLIPPKK